MSFELATLNIVVPRSTPAHSETLLPSVLVDMVTSTVGVGQLLRLCVVVESVTVWWFMKVQCS